MLVLLGISIGFKQSPLDVTDKEMVPVEVIVNAGMLQAGLAVVLLLEIKGAEGIQTITKQHIPCLYNNRTNCQH